MNQNPMVDITLENGPQATAGNDPIRAEALRDMALGLFIHWSVDCGYPMPLSHWMCAADTGIVGKFIHDAPSLFYPRDFQADEFARFARKIGARYSCFTTKHHNGFCMWDTATTDFNVMKTPFARDIHRELIDAFRRHGVEPGLYFSPMDFRWCHETGRKTHFLTDEVHPEKNPGLLDLNRRQLTELLTRYGDVRMVFFDGPPRGLKDLVWKLQPGCTITRGEVETPEQGLPEKAASGLWEGCFTVGDEWNWMPTMDHVKTGTELIELLITTRARGGNLLLNIGPDHHGRIPPAQEGALLELGQFLMFSGEGIYGTRPWHVEREGNIWYTKAKDADTVYAFVTKEEWTHGFLGQRKALTLRKVRATEETTVSILGQSGEVLEHKPLVDTRSYWKQDDGGRFSRTPRHGGRNQAFGQDERGLHLDMMLCLRQHGRYKWPNPNVIRITHAEKA